MKEFMNKPQIKNVLLSVLALIIGGLFSALGDWKDKSASFYYKVGFLAILMIVYIVLLIFYSVSEVNYRRIRKLLEDRIKAYEEIMMGIDNVCKESANSANAVIHEIIEQGNCNLNIWNFDKACMLVCSQLYSLLKNLSGGETDFGIAYIKLIEDKKPENTIKMCGFANQNMHKPSIYGKKRRIDNNDDKNYHDIDLFISSNSEIEVIIGCDKINDLFEYSSKKSRQKNRNKYNQFVAIPVFCDDSKMIGLLEVVCFNNATLGNNEKEVKEIASKYFVPYSYLLLLLHKIEKALMAKPQ